MTKKQRTWNLDGKRRFSAVKINDESTVEALEKLKVKEMILSKNLHHVVSFGVCVLY